MAENRNTNASTYNDDSIQTLAWNEHIRQRPGMYVGRFGDGSQSDDGMYVLIKEVMDNSIDEYMMGHGKTIEVTIEGRRVTIRDYGRGIPLNKLSDAVSKMNTGGKFEDSTTFRKSVGLNGVGVKAVNALSSEFTVRSVRDGQARTVSFSRGYELSDRWEEGVQEKNGLWVSFVPDDDEKIFGNYAYNYEFVEPMFRRYTYLNPGLTVKFNGKAFLSKNGLLDLLNDNLSEEPLYPPIHLTGEDIEVVITHGSGYGETYYSFVNGQYTTLGGTHQAAFREAVAKTVKEFYKKDYDPADVRTSIIAALSIKVENPMFENQPQDQVRLEGRGRGRPIGAQFHHGFRQGAAGRLPAHAPRDGQCAGQEGGLQREGTQGHIGRPEEGARNGQEGEPQQQETARLSYPPKRHERRQSGRQLHLHYRGRLGKRFYYEKPRSEPASGFQPSRQTVKQFRTDEEDRIRKRRIQFATGCIEHRGWIGRLTLQ